MLVSRMPGASFSEATSRSVSPSMLFRWTPVPGTTTPEPQPVEQVSEAAFPSASSTLIWVVQGDCEGQLTLAACATWPFRGRRQHPPHGAAAVERALERRRPLRVRRAQRGRDARHAPGASAPAQRRAAGEHGQRVRDQRAARGRRRVRDERALAVGQRRAGGGGSRGRRRGRPRSGGRRSRPGARRARARSRRRRARARRWRRCARACRRAAGCSCGRRPATASSGRAEDARALGRGAEEALEQRDHVGVRRRQLDARARERDGRAASARPSGRRPSRRCARLETGRDARHGARARPDEERLLPGAEVDDVRLERRDRRRRGPAPGTATKQSMRERAPARGVDTRPGSRRRRAR